MEKLEIGNTGEEFVAMFNSNFSKIEKLLFYNVEDYGAMHDGITDDTEAIQNAINACYNAGGGTIFFPNGIYIVSGVLQNGIDGVDYNSQIYIPGHKTGSGAVTIRLLGESSMFYQYNDKGVILRSTIAGSGVNPSVICSTSTLNPNYYKSTTGVIIENIKVQVNAFETTTGPSMCGINLLFAGRSYLNEVFVEIDCDYEIAIEPEIKVFGLAVGFLNNDFPRWGTVSSLGFYYGLVIGEGVTIALAEIYFCKYGIMSIRNAYSSNIIYAVVNWCAYCLTAQQNAMYGVNAGNSHISIANLSIEDGTLTDGRTPDWCVHVAPFLDKNNFLYGFVNYLWSAENGGFGTSITKTDSKNLIIKNMAIPSFYHWTTDTRPTIPGTGIMGFNTTTKKLEYWNETDWVEIPAAT